MGSDTVAGVLMANKYYNSPMAGFSIPAAEHSSITSWGQDREVDAYRNMLQFAKPDALVAVVSDSYDLFNAVENLWGETLRQEVIDSGATLIIRPDSGHPAAVVLKTLQLLDKKFGSTINSKGYKVLNNVRVIQGDGINQDSIEEILAVATKIGNFSATNIAFGMGGGLLQQVNRDTQKFAYKCSLATVDGVEVEVFKNPITDPGKKSKKGRLDLVKDEKGYRTVQVAVDGDLTCSELITVYENGQLMVEYTLEEIRKRVLDTTL
jgi:nicotinamide phosphoribosyltransferase